MKRNEPKESKYNYKYLENNRYYSPMRTNNQSNSANKSRKNVKSQFKVEERLI